MGLAWIAVALPCLSGAQEARPADTSASLWQAYAAAPDTHPNLANCSYAGYRAGELPLPAPPVVTNVRQWAKGDGVADDTAAFARAVEDAHAKGGGAILVPAGHYRLTGLVHLDRPGVVLRGEGIGKTVLVFENPLATVLGHRPGGNGPQSSEYSWLGGLVHVGVHGDLGPDGKLAPAQPFPQAWSFGETVCSVAGRASRGDRALNCDVGGAGQLKAGQLVGVRWRNPPDHSLLNEIYGGDGFPWRKAHGAGQSGERLVELRSLTWPVEIQAVRGGHVELRQPLRVPVEPQWGVTLVKMGPVISEVGVEEMTLRMKDHLFAAHHNEPGYSGLYFNRVVHGWVRNVRVENADNGFIGSAIKNVTVTGLQLASAGQLPQTNPAHHGTVLRAGSHDVLFSEFAIELPVLHGIETEQLSSGNVWRRGKLAHGTIDTHRGMPFESIFTQLELHNDGRPGGDRDAGPASGARMAHWNLLVHGSGRWVYQPDHLSRGALVGVRGVPADLRASEAMGAGSKHTVVADDGAEPQPADLYQAQLNLRLGK